MFAAPGLFTRRGSPGRTHRAKLILGGVLALVGLCGLTPQAKADFTLELDTVISGPSSSRTFATATFAQNGANTVRLTLTANLIDSEFIGGFYFNFTPDTSVGSLVVSPINVTAVNGNATVNLGTDDFGANGAHDFDIWIDLPPPPGSFDDKFTGTEVLVFDFTLTGLTPDFFNVANEDGHMPYKGAAHVQGFGPNGNDSLWVGDGNGDTPGPQEVPVPPSAVLLALGFAGVGFTGWRRRKKADA